MRNLNVMMSFRKYFLLHSAGDLHVFHVLKIVEFCNLFPIKPSLMKTSFGFQSCCL